MRIRWKALLLTLLLALPASAKEDERVRGPRVGDLPLVGWFEVEGPSFTLYSSSDKRSVVGLAKRILSFVQVARLTTNIERFEPRVPIRILVFDGSDYLGLFGSGTGGWMIPGAERFNLLVRGDNPQFLLHEYTHYLAHNQGLAYPSWFDEGFAELISTVWFREDLAYVGAPPPSRVGTLRRNTRLLPLRMILGAREYPSEVMSMFYAQSWLLTHYLHTAHSFGDPKLLESMQQYLELLHSNTPWATAFDRAFEPSVEQLEDRLAQHHKRLLEVDATFPILRLEVGLPDTSQLHMRKVAPARIAEIIGDAHLALIGPTQKTESFYRESLDLAGDRPTAKAGLARVLARQGRFRQARELVKAASSAAPDSLSIQLAQSEVKVLEAKAESPPDALLLEEAREILRALQRREPLHPAAYIALAESYLDVDGEVDEGIAALEHIGASTPALVPGLTLAKLYRAAGRRSDARNQLRAVVRWHGGDAADEARELLKELARDDANEFDDDLETAEDPFKQPPSK